MYLGFNSKPTYTVTPAQYAGAPFTGALSRTTGAITDAFEAVGTYNIGQGTLSAGANYEITFVDGDFEIYYFKGDGLSEETAYEIGTARQLAGLAGLVNVAATNSDFGDKYYKLTADINLTGTWTPIGTNTTGRQFRGNFDGNGKIVKGLNVSSGSYIGLFGFINGSVKNLGVEGSVTGSNYVGGLAGSVYGGSSSVTNCYSAVVVSGVQYVGGLAGTLSGNGLIVANCYATGSVSGNREVGGLVGLATAAASVTSCYTTSAVSGNQRVAGLVGYSDNYGSVRNSAALNPSIINTSDGPSGYGRVGGNSGSRTNNIAWDGMTVMGSTVTSGAGATTIHGEDVTAANAKLQSTYVALGWEFGDGKPWKWGGSDYPLPVLHWQEEGTYPALPAHLQ